MKTIAEIKADVGLLFRQGKSISFSCKIAILHLLGPYLPNLQSIIAHNEKNVYGQIEKSCVLHGKFLSNNE